MTKKISELTAADALDGTEQVEVVQAGVSKRAEVGEFQFDLGWSTISSVAATTIPDATVSSSSTSVASAGGHFTAAMDGQAFYLPNGGPVLVSGSYAWEASPLIGTFTYVSATSGTLSSAATTAVNAGEMIIGPDATSAINAAVATGRGQIPANVDLIVAGEISVGSGQVLAGAGPELSRLFSVTQKGNVVTSAWTTSAQVRDLAIFGNGWGSQPSNADPGEGVAPTWANSGCGIIFARTTRGLIENVHVHHCGGDGVTSNRNGVAGIWATMGCIETQVGGCTTLYCRNGINEDNYFSGVGQLWNPLSNTFDRNTTDYCRFGMAVDSGSLSRGCSISSHVSRFCVQSGIDIHSSKYVSVISPRCEFNGVNYTNAGIVVYGTSALIPCENITIISPTCHGNGTHGVKFSDYVTAWKIIGGVCNRNFRHGVYVNTSANDGEIIGVAVRDNGQGSDSPGTYDGVRITSSQRVHVRVTAIDDQGSPTQNYGIRVDGSANAVTIDEGCKFSGNAVAPVLITGSTSRVSARTRTGLSNAAQGFKGETFHRTTAGGTSTPAAGDQRATLVGVFNGELITNLYLDVTAAGTGITLAKLCVWDSAGTLLASTADIDSTFTSGTGPKGAALSSPYLVEDDTALYLGAVFVGGTAPTLLRGTSGITGYTSAGLSGPPLSIVNTGKSDAANFTALTTSSTALWVGWT